MRPCGQTIVNDCQPPLLSRVCTRKSSTTSSRRPTRASFDYPQRTPHITNPVGKEVHDLEDSSPRERHEHLEAWSEKIKYLEPDFAELFCKALAGLTPDGTADAGFHGRELARNAAVAQLALASGLRLQEFRSLLVWEIPVLPAQRTAAPIPFAVPEGVTKGRKARTTWLSWEALAAVHDYLQLDRPATVDGVAWRPPGRWGEVLQVTDPGGRGGLVNGVRQRWETLTPPERRRLVAPGGASAVLAGEFRGGPFTPRAALFDRTARCVRPRFGAPVPPHQPH